MRSKLGLLTLCLVAMAGCAQAPNQTGTDQVPGVNVEIARTKDGKFEEMTWPLVDDILTEWLDGVSAPGCAVGVTIDSEIIYLHGYGRARIGGSGEAWSVGTMGAVGSVSKFFTAAAAMRQVEAGWIDIEADAGDWLPFSGDLSNAPLFKLLSHTSGVGGNSKGQAFAPNWNDDAEIAACAGVPTPDPTDPACTETHRLALDPTWLAEQYNDNEADHVATLPGVNVDDDQFIDGWEAIYSNVGYVVAGGVVGAVAQAHGYQGYEDYVWRRVGQWSNNWLTPGQATSLALIHAHRATDIPHRAVGYYDANWGTGSKDWTTADVWQTESDGGYWIGPAGGWALTIGDLTRLMVAFRTNKIVTWQTRSVMESALGYFSLGPDASSLPPYGLGVFVDDVNQTIWSGGDIGVANGSQVQSTHAGHWSWWPNTLPGNADVGVTLICNNGKGSSTLYSRAKDIVQALQADPDSRPVPKMSIATAPPPADVRRGTWILDTSRAYLIAPAGLSLMLSAIAPIELSADLPQQRATLRTAASPKPIGFVPNLTLTSSGRLEGRGGFAHLPLRSFGVIGQTAQNPNYSPYVTVDYLETSIQVSNDAAHLFDGVVKGTIDARNLTWIGASASDVCRVVREAGSACGPCADGVRVCFPAALGGIGGKRTGGGPTPGAPRLAAQP